MTASIHESAEQWRLLAPFTKDAALKLGWTLDAMTPIRDGSAELILRHAQLGTARVRIYRNAGAPVGVAHTNHLDFVLMNEGGGSARTEDSLQRALVHLTTTLRGCEEECSDLALLDPFECEQASSRRSGPNLAAPERISKREIDALIAELEAADAATLGVGFHPERGPDHTQLRILTLLGTGACDNECLFCIEKHNPAHRRTLNAGGAQKLILDSAGRYDMLFFASGEPSIHPRLFDDVELARSVGFTAFGMSSHFRTFADPRFALKTLEAGFAFFDIALHAADPVAQLEINPIGDEGRSLFEALKGLGVLLRLASAHGIPISITQKIVASRLNVMNLEAIVRMGYERGIRHFIVQPVRTVGLALERQARLEIAEEEIVPHLNTLLARTAGLGITIKPYGFARGNLLSADHVEIEPNRVKNVAGISTAASTRKLVSMMGPEERPADGRHWIELKGLNGRIDFAVAESVPILDEALRQGADLPFGCRMGSCGMCCARLGSGRVDQSQQKFLSEEQVGRGLVLLCQARPRSDVMLELCSDDEIAEL